MFGRDREFNKVLARGEGRGAGFDDRGDPGDEPGD